MNALFCRKAKRDVDDGAGQIVESTDSRPRRYYLDRKTDAGSVPYSTTIQEGSDSLRALFLA